MRKLQLQIYNRDTYTFIPMMLECKEVSRDKEKKSITYSFYHPFEKREVQGKINLEFWDALSN